MRATTRGSVDPFRSGSSSVTTTGTPRRSATATSHAIRSTAGSASAARKPGCASTTTSTESSRSSNVTTVILPREVVVEEGDDSPLVLAWARGQTAGVLRAGHFPELLGLLRAAVEIPVGGPLHLLALLAVDKEGRAVDLRDEARQRLRRQVVGEEGRRDRDDAVTDHRLPRGVVDEVVANGAAARALGDDRLQRRRLGRGLDQDLAAD